MGVIFRSSGSPSSLCSVSPCFRFLLQSFHLPLHHLAHYFPIFSPRVSGICISVSSFLLFLSVLVMISLCSFVGFHCLLWAFCIVVSLFFLSSSLVLRLVHGCRFFAPIPSGLLQSGLASPCSSVFSLRCLISVVFRRSAFLLVGEALRWPRVLLCISFPPFLYLDEYVPK